MSSYTKMRDGSPRKSHNYRDLTGQKFNRWTVLYRVENYRNKYSAWYCRCDCGNEGVVKAINLRTNTSKSCGCYGREIHKAKRGKKNIKAQKADAGLNTVYARYRCQDRRVGRKFLIAKETFRVVIQQNCFYCGDPPSNKLVTHAGNIFLYNGIDRVDNSHGHEVWNIVPCCHTCNALKQEFSQHLFFEKICKIYRQHGERFEKNNLHR
jgi:hypothetical protein